MKKYYYKYVAILSELSAVHVEGLDLPLFKAVKKIRSKIKNSNLFIEKIELQDCFIKNND